MSHAVAQTLRYWTSYNYRIATHYLSALINGDQTGITSAESRDFREWERRARESAQRGGYTVGHWAQDASCTDVGESFARCEISGMQASCEWVSLMVYKEGADAWAEMVHPFAPAAYPMPDGATMPRGFVPTGYGNDACPSIAQEDSACDAHPGFAVKVWIDAPDADARECDAGGRFLVCIIDQDGQDQGGALACDAWADVLRHVATQEERARVIFESGATWDRFDICEAYHQLEADYNVGGILRERGKPFSVGVQLHRMHYRRGRSSQSFRSMSDNAQAIYRAAVRRLNLPE